MGSGLTVSAAGIVSGTPTNADSLASLASPITVTVTATDNGVGALFVLGSFQLTVTDVANPPALIAPIGDQTATQDQAFALDVSGNFLDADAEALVYTATGLPASLTISAAGAIRRPSSAWTAVGPTSPPRRSRC